jgi:hypothetical protein
MSEPKFTQVERYEICAKAPIHMRTLEAVLAGRPVRSISRHRVRLALQALGWVDRFPELFAAPIPPARDPDPGRLLPEGEE